MIPVVLGLLNPNGDEILPTTVLEVTEPVQSFRFPAPVRPVPSILRGFSAPVVLERSVPAAEHGFLLAHDTDPFNRWEAGRALARDTLVRMVAEDAPAVAKPAAPAKPKRKGNPEALKRWRESQKAAAATVEAKPEKVKKSRKKSRKKAAKPAAESVKRRGDEAVDTFGAIEIVDYTRKDGTPGVMLRPKGRSRGVAFARGDFALFCAFANTFRKGETMDPIVRKVKARIGG